MIENHRLKNKWTKKIFPGEWFLPRNGEEGYIEKQHDVKVLWIDGNENHAEIGFGLDVSAVALDPQQAWEKAEPVDSEGFFRIRNPKTKLYLTGSLDENGNRIETIQKEISCKLKCLVYIYLHQCFIHC